MKFVEAMIAWEPADLPGSDPNQVKVGPWPDRTGWSNRYLSTRGACYPHMHRMTPDQQQAQVFIAFNALVVDDGMDPQVAHREFLKIDEYRYSISLAAGADAALQESHL